MQIHAQTEVNGMKFTVLSEEERTVSLTGFVRGKIDSVANIPEKVVMEEGGPAYTVREINVNFISFLKVAAVNVPKTVTRITRLSGSLRFTHLNFAKDSQLKVIGANPWGRQCIRGSFTEIVLPESLDSLNQKAFSDCSKLTEITLNKGLKYIGESAFMNCTSLYGITLNDGLNTIGKKAFYGCSKLTEITLNKGLKYIGESAFENCTSLYGITLNDGLNTIGKKAFYGCGQLSEITLNEGLEMIDEKAFCGCEQLETVTLPASLDFIGNEAFYNSVRDVYPKRPAAPCIDWYTFNRSVVVHVENIAQYKAYHQDEKWKDYEYATTQDKVTYEWVGETSVKVVGNEAEVGDRLVVPARVTLDGYTFDVTSIDNEALNGKAEEIVVKAPVTSIGHTGEVSGCLTPFPNLKRITLPETLQRIEYLQFFNAPLEEITLPKNVSYIGFGAFAHTSIKSIVIPEGVDTVRSGTFENCRYLMSLQFPKNLKVIENEKYIRHHVYDRENKWSDHGPISFLGTFYGTHIEEITLPDGVEDIAEDAFYGNDGLKAFHVKGEHYFDRDGVLMHRTSADKGNRLVLVKYPEAKKDKEYTVADDVDSLGCNAFYGVKMEVLNLSSSIKWIRGLEFSNSGQVNIPEGPVGLADRAFYGIWTPVLSLPASLKYISSSAFSHIGVGRGETKMVYLQGEVPAHMEAPWNSSDSGKVIISFIPTFCVKPSALAAYQADSVWAAQHLITTDQQCQTDNMLFVEQEDGSAMLLGVVRNVTGEVVIPAQVSVNGTARQVTTIGNGAFYFQRGMTRCTVPASVQKIETYAFSYNGLKQIDIASGSQLREIGVAAFEGDSISRFDIPDEMPLEWIGNAAFEGTCIESVYLPAQTRLGKGVFNSCYDLKHIDVNAANPYYKVMGDVLYDAQTGAFQTYAAGNKQDSLVILGDQQTMAFWFDASKLKKLYLLGHERPILTSRNYLWSDKMGLTLYVRESVYDKFMENEESNHWYPHSESPFSFIKDIKAIPDAEADAMISTLGIRNTPSFCRSTDDNYYRLDGVRTTNPVKGVYIHQGHKVVK